MRANKGGQKSYNGKQSPGLGSILDTASKDTEDTALSSILSVSYRYIFGQLLLMVSLSK